MVRNWLLDSDTKQRPTDSWETSTVIKYSPINGWELVTITLTVHVKNGYYHRILMKVDSEMVSDKSLA